jgi:hypothetical protein
MDPLYPTPDNGKQDVLLALRALFSRCPQTMSEGPETQARLLWEGRYLFRRPADHEIEAALGTMSDEDGEVLP